MHDLARILRQPDPGELVFQIAEIAGDRTYLRHGVDVGAGDVVLDVGANVGVAAAFFAVQCGAGRVHCFEPVAPIFDLLTANVGGLPACVLHPYGLAARAGRAAITYYPHAGAMSGLYADPDADSAVMRTALGNLGVSEDEADERVRGRFEARRLTCELRTLSGCLREEGIDHVDLLKVDVERAEADVLEGIADRDWPRIEQLVLEVHDERDRLRRLSSALRRRGFKVAGEQEDAMRGTTIWMLYATRR